MARLLLVLALLMPACASDPASGERPWNRPAAYGRLDLLGLADGGLPDYGRTEVTPAVAEGVAIGYRFSPRISAETGVEYIDGAVSYGGTPVTVWKLFQVPVQAKVHLLEGRFQPLLVAGAGWFHFDEDSAVQGAFVRAGAGFEWNYADNWALSATGTWDQPLGVHDELNHLTVLLGIVFRF